MRWRPAKILRVLGGIYLAIAFIVIATGYVAVIIFEGWGRFFEIISPTNIINWIVSMAVILPGIGLCALAARIEKP
jgi:hypothetical protein